MGTVRDDEMGAALIQQQHYLFRWLGSKWHANLTGFQYAECCQNQPFVASGEDDYRLLRRIADLP